MQSSVRLATSILTVPTTDITNLSQTVHFPLCFLQSHCFSRQGSKKPLLVDRDLMLN